MYLSSYLSANHNQLEQDDDDSDDEYFGDSLDPCDDQFILQSHLASDDLPCRDPFDDRYSFGGLIPLSTRPMTGGFADPRGPPPIFNQLFEAQPPKRRLGPLNGEYDIASDEPTGNLVNSNGTRVDPKICLALNWNEMFGSIKLGILEGTLWIPERPKKASEEKVPFKWYGKVSGQLIGHENSGWIRFLGDGEIEGEISSLRRYSFVGQRISGENTVAVSSVYELRREWFGYVNQVNEALLNGLIG